MMITPIPSISHHIKILQHFGYRHSLAIHGKTCFCHLFLIAFVGVQMGLLVKPLPGWPGYLIGEDGSVWTVWLTKHEPVMVVGMEPRLVKQCNKTRYPRLCLYDITGKRHYRRVHYLVLEAFVGSRPPGLLACHKDDNKQNNRLSNLYWGTEQENHEDAKKNGKRPFGSKHSRAKLTEAIVAECRTRHVGGESIGKLAKEFSVADEVMRCAIKGKTWKHVGTTARL